MYSGGVDTSISVYLLKHFYGYQVITLTIDVCQDTEWAKKMAKKEDTKKPSKEVSDSDDLELVQDNDEFIASYTCDNIVFSYNGF